MSEERYEVTKETILKMVEKCPEAKEVLKAGFPQAFENEKHFNLVALTKNGYLFTNEEARKAGFENKLFIQVRGIGQYAGIAFRLQENDLKWELRHDDLDQLCLTVERK